MRLRTRKGMKKMQNNDIQAERVMINKESLFILQELISSIVEKRDPNMKEGVDIQKTIQDIVYEEIYDGIKRGDVIFKDEQLSADRWKRLPDDEKENRALKWKYGKNVLVDLLAHQLIKKGQLVSGLVFHNGNGRDITIGLTEAGKMLSQIGSILQMDMKEYFTQLSLDEFEEIMKHMPKLEGNNKKEGHRRYKVM